MDKLKLSLDELRVETFRTEANDAERGTVNGNMVSFGGSNCDTCKCTSRVGACFCTENLSCNCQ